MALEPWRCVGRTTQPQSAAFDWSTSQSLGERRARAVTHPVYFERSTVIWPPADMAAVELGRKRGQEHWRTGRRADEGDAAWAPRNRVVRRRHALSTPPAAGRGARAGFRDSRERGRADGARARAGGPRGQAALLGRLGGRARIR